MGENEFVNTKETSAERIGEIEALERMVRAQATALCAKDNELKLRDEKISSLNDQVKTLGKTIEELQQKIGCLEKMLSQTCEALTLRTRTIFGRSSEQSNPDQLSLFAVPVAPTPELDKTPVVVKEHQRKPKSTFEEKFGKLKTAKVCEHSLDEKDRICPDCGCVMEPIETVVKRLISIVPALAEVIEHRFPQYACRHCNHGNKDRQVVQADDTVSVYPNCIATPESISHIITQRVVMSLPLYRQEKYWRGQGIHLSRQTMDNWLMKCSELYFEPIRNVLADLLVQLDMIHADETPYPVLHDGDKKSKRGYMWLFTSGAHALNQIVIFVYSKTRGIGTPEEFLKKFTGYVHADGYQVYKNLLNVLVAECWAHLRRKIYEANLLQGKNSDPDNPTRKALQFCDAIFHIDSQFASLDSHERKRRRESELRPIVEEFFTWLESLTNLPNNTFGKAVNHALKQREYLMRFFEDGRLELSNNRAERSVRPMVIGRKNSLFANTARGAKALAVLYSLSETAQACGLEPGKYFTWVLQQAPALCKADPDWAERLVPHNAPEECKVP